MLKKENALATTPEKHVVTRIVDFASDCATLDLASFVHRHGKAFLLHWGELGDGRKPTTDLSRTTNLIEPPKEVTGRRPARPQMDFVVIPVRWTGRSPYSHFIAVGRTANNDVVLPDDSISKFHAFFKQDEERFILQDAGSKNGTFVDDELVLAAQVGRPTELASGARVRFGTVELTFLPAAEFCKFVRGVIREK
jgi:hypothetical protein